MSQYYFFLLLPSFRTIQLILFPIACATRGRRGRGRMCMAVGFKTTYIVCNRCLSPLKLCVRIQLRRGVLDTTLCDKISDLPLVGGFLWVLYQYN
jgi:hypothetical protein